MTMIYDRSDGQELRMNTIGSWLKKRYGKKIVKLSIDSGLTCPNRDGTKGTGGCLFCSGSGSGDHASSMSFADDRSPVNVAGTEEALKSQIRLLSDKWPDAGYIAYFQSHTNTYGPGDMLRRYFESALSYPDVLGLAIATRPDCISDPVLELLDELNEQTFLWVELGLQSIHSATEKAMNLCYDLSDYDRAVRLLHDHHIPVVTHLILGLPGEDHDMMLESVKHVCRPLPRRTPKIGLLQDGSSGSPEHIFGIKLHMLNVVSDSALAEKYPGYVPFSTMDEYTDLAVKALEIIPSDITIHRIYGDAPKETLLAPTWARRKRQVLNEINRKLREKDTWQGRLTD